MEPSNFVGLAVVAAIVSAIVAGIGLWLNTKTALAMHSEKLEFEREHERWRRRTDLAEKVLEDFYNACDIVRRSRSPASFGNEGQTRHRNDWETESETRLLNSYFCVIERQEHHSEFFAEMYSRRHRVDTLLGDELGRQYDDLWAIRVEISTAVHMLIETLRESRDDVQRASMRDVRRQWEAAIGWCVSDEDPILPRLDQLRRRVCEICRPVINGPGALV